MTRYCIAILLIVYVNIFSQTGIVSYTDLEGNISSEESFIDGVHDGNSYWFYPNGNIKEEKNFSLGKLNGWVRSYYGTGLLKTEFFTNNGIKDGIEKNYYKNGALKSIIRISSGIIVEKKEFDEDPLYKASIKAYRAGNRQELIRKRKNQELICTIDVCPEPIGGMKAIEDKLVYPKEALIYKLEGVVKVIAQVNLDGRVLEAHVLSGIGLGCDEAAIKAIKETTFLPGEDNGKSVISDVLLKIIFALNEKTKFELSGKSKIADKFANVEKEILEEKNLEEKVTFENNFTCPYNICPKPKNGIQEIIKNITIPPTAQRLEIKGVVIAVAHIDRYGFAQNVNIKKGLGYGIDEAVISAIYKTEFTPAKDNGNFIDCNVTIKLKIGN